MLNTIKNTVATAVLTSVSLLTPMANAATWDGTPSTTNFNFGYFLDNMFIQKAIVKTGELTTNFGQTEVQVIYNTGGCPSDQFLQVEMGVELVEYGRTHTEYSITNPTENTNNVINTFQIEDIKIFPENMTVTVSANCYYY